MCSCGWLVMMVNERPTVFAYSDGSGFFVRGTDRTQYPIQHCPWCGEALPKRVEEGVIAPSQEYARILNNASAVRTPEDCFTIFGEPDYDKPVPDEKGMPTDLRNIEYYNLSDWYTLEFYFTDPNYNRFVIHAKSIPLKRNAEP